MTDTMTKPAVDTKTGDHDRFSHIVGGNDRGQTGPELVSIGLIFGTHVTALCGKRWVPSRDARKYPVCQDCKDKAIKRGLPVPQG